MKTIIITGASGGIGKQISTNLAKKNNRLILVYNKSKKAIDDLKNKLSNKCEIITYKCNLTKAEEINNMVDDIVLKFKKVDALINCAGVSKFLQIQDTTEKDFYNIIDNNLKSAVMLTARVSKNMIFNKQGKIINISSMWGVVGSSMESLYSLTKAGINNLTLSLAKELGPSNITVNAICPGLINTKMNNNLSKETIDEIISCTPLQRIGQPEDIANIVEFLISEKSNFITGQIITVDGGFSL